MTQQRSIVIVGGGHNGLVAAAYLARAGLAVTVLEKQPHVGGAAVSAHAFEGVDARLSRYSYLVSLLPQRIIDDLELDLTLARRRYSSFTPEPGGETGLLVDTGDLTATAASFASIGAAGDAAAWTQFYNGTERLARALFPTLTEPLPTRSEARAALADDELWNALIERPLGEIIEATFSNDLVRGVVLTDALIGTFVPAHDGTLSANRCFLYHVIGGGTGDWDVPVGGMGAVSGELERSARLAGATILTDATVTSIDPATGDVHYLRDGAEDTVHSDRVLANVAPAVLQRLLDDTDFPVADGTHTLPGAQAKVNLVLSRLPRLRDSSIDPVAAFGGTFHINETYSQLQHAYDTAVGGSVPEPVPAEIYCHSLTDPSILSPELQATGAQTLTVFALHVPHSLVDANDHDAWRQQVQEAVIRSLNSVLAEPIEPLLLLDAHGNPCIETKTTLDLENTIDLPAGNIFHGGLDWPFVDDDTDLTTPAARWGVATAHERVLLCGSGARRGGGVSGIGGHNAAMAVLETL
ncbi:MAG TPA: NAD(P)/FAD-dependent oxidoreductase [Terrimesophilobacter sp.]|nr:NAD(P)/FAD-dependent oxidoreductase [Terrimesophilobacter sp.]